MMGLSQSTLQWNEAKNEKYLSYPTTTQISYQESKDEFEGKLTYIDDWDDEPPTHKPTTYRKLKVIITASVGINAGIPFEWIYNKPGEIICSTNDAHDYKIYTSLNTQPNRKFLIKNALSLLHALPYQISDEYSSFYASSDYKILRRKQFNSKYIFIPTIFNLSTELSVMLNINKEIIDIILSYSQEGFIQIKLNFIPSHTFEPINITIIDNMYINELNSLVVTYLFAKYKINIIPYFRWYDNTGMRYRHYENGSQSKMKQYHDKSISNMNSNEFTLIFNKNILKLTNNVAENIQYHIYVNVVGHGYQQFYFKDPKKVKYRHLEKLCLKIIGKETILKESGIIAAYPSDMCEGKKYDAKLYDTFYLNGRKTQQWPDRTDMKVFPDKQNKKFMVFDEDKYKSILNVSLFDLCIESGCVLNMYQITGPCISVCFATMVGDLHHFDVNFSWKLEIFKMYLKEFQHRGSFHFESNDFDFKNMQTVGDICNQFKNGNVWAQKYVVCRMD